jgi:hypothetical protein
MAIRTGIGVGAAQIADTSGIMNAYARQIAQQQKLQAAQAQRDFLSAEKEKERAERAAAKFDEDLADIMASAKLGGIRDVDVPEITKAYNEVKEFYSKSGSLKDSQKPLFRAELRNRMNTINDAAINSKEVEKKRYATAAKVSENPWDYDPKVIQDLDYVNKTPLSKLGGMANMDPLNYQKLPNFGLIDNIIDDTYKIGKENAKFAGQVFEKGQRYKVKRVEPALIQDNLVQRFTTSPEALRAISNLYSRELGKQPTNEELTNYIMDKYKTKHSFDYVGEPLDLKEPKSGGGEDQDKYTYRQQIITGALENDPGSINKIKAALPPGSKIVAYRSFGTDKSKGGYNSLKITIPQGNDARGNPLPKLEQTIEASRGEGVIKLNRILNTYTGENISDSKLGIKGGKLAGQQIEVNIPKPKATTPSIPTATRAEWKAAGWSDSDINEGIKQKVIKVK